MTQEEINTHDDFGNTPLSLSVKLAHKSPDYCEIAKILIYYGADPKVFFL